MSTFYPTMLALLPALIGPLPDARDQLTVKICGSDAVITISLGGDAPDPGPDPACHEKACHAGSNRKKFDPAQ